MHLSHKEMMMPDKHAAVTQEMIGKFAENVDHHSQFYSENVVAIQRTMQARCPIIHSDLHGGFWVATKYRTVMDIARNTEVFSSAHGLLVPLHDIPRQV